MKNLDKDLQGFLVDLIYKKSSLLQIPDLGLGQSHVTDYNRDHISYYESLSIMGFIENVVHLLDHGKTIFKFRIADWYMIKPFVLEQHPIYVGDPTRYDPEAPAFNNDEDWHVHYLLDLSGYIIFKLKDELCVFSYFPHLDEDVFIKKERYWNIANMMNTCSDHFETMKKYYADGSHLVSTQSVIYDS